MSEQPLFLLVLLNEGFLINHWAFRAANETEVMRHLLANCWDYDRLFRALRIDLRKIDEVTPEELLQAINDDMYTYSLTRMASYLIRVASSDICQVNPENERTTA